VVFSLDEIKAMKNAVGGTVNDLVLAICSGALRRYLSDKQELPEDSLVAQCPISVRDPNVTSQGGNQVSSMTVSLKTNILHVKRRVLAICEATRNAKEMAHAIGAETMLGPMQFMQSELASLGARAAAYANEVDPAFNCVITNVPGSQVPQYDTGAKKVRSLAIGPPVEGNGLFHGVSSYCGEVTIGVTCCRKMMPDPDVYVDCLRSSFNSLKKALLTKGAKKKNL
jgi:WS/DGAT/MGAT family acyltransferase